MSIRFGELPNNEPLNPTDTFATHNSDRGTGSVPISVLQEYLRGGLYAFGPGGVPYGKELKDDWATLKTRAQKGDFDGIHIGDYKTINLTGGEVVIAEVAGIDTYYKCADQEI